MHGSNIESHRRSSLTNGELAELDALEPMITDQSTVNEVSTRHYQSTRSSLIEKKTVRPSDDEYEDDDDDDDGQECNGSVTHTADFFRWTHGHRRVMLTFSTICLFAFMTGVEYAVILPTAADYVKTMTDVDIYVGLILSSYSISGSIAGVIMGKISDITGKVKILIIVSNIFEIGGNILYFVTNDIRIVLLGRFIAGVGMGAVPPILADVAHRTTEKDRTKAISIILGCRQLGLLIGPCFTLLVRMMNFHIGSVHVNHLNGPGFLMTTIWLTLQIVCWLCFYDRTPSTKAGPSNSSDSPKHKYTRSDQTARREQNKLSCQIYSDQYFRIEMIVLFLATFIAYFNQTALETIVATFTGTHFGWDAVHTSILFAFAGLEIIVVYLSLVFILSKRFQDRFLLVFGFLSLTLACTLGTFFTWSSYSFGWTGQTANGVVDQRLFCMFIIFVVLDLLGLPFLAATSVSLFTKLTIKELQGFSQGVQRFIMGIGTIIGPIFASALLHRLHIMMTTMLALTSLTLVALICVIQRLRPLSEKHPSTNNTDANNNLNKNVSVDENIDPSESGPSSKNCYIILVQCPDKENRSPNLKSISPIKRSSLNNSLRFDTSSTNILCQSDDQKRLTRNDSINQSSSAS